MSEKKAEVEYPRWVYPPDGGPGKIVQTPDECPKGWLTEPVAPQGATGERVIGTPEHPSTPLDQTAGARPVPPPPADDEGDDDGRKSKRK